MSDQSTGYLETTIVEGGSSTSTVHGTPSTTNPPQIIGADQSITVVDGKAVTGPGTNGNKPATAPANPNGEQKKPAEKKPGLTPAQIAANFETNLANAQQSLGQISPELSKMLGGLVDFLKQILGSFMPGLFPTKAGGPQQPAAPQTPQQVQQNAQMVAEMGTKITEAFTKLGANPTPDGLKTALKEVAAASFTFKDDAAKAEYMKQIDQAVDRANADGKLSTEDISKLAQDMTEAGKAAFQLSQTAPGGADPRIEASRVPLNNFVKTLGEDQYNALKAEMPNATPQQLGDALKQKISQSIGLAEAGYAAGKDGVQLQDGAKFIELANKAVDDFIASGSKDPKALSEKLRDALQKTGGTIATLNPDGSRQIYSTTPAVTPTGAPTAGTTHTHQTQDTGKRIEGQHTATTVTYKLTMEDMLKGGEVDKMGFSRGGRVHYSADAKGHADPHGGIGWGQLTELFGGKVEWAKNPDGTEDKTHPLKITQPVTLGFELMGDDPQRPDYIRVFKAGEPEGKAVYMQPGGVDGIPGITRDLVNPANQLRTPEAGAEVAEPQNMYAQTSPEVQQTQPVRSVTGMQP